MREAPGLSQPGARVKGRSIQNKKILQKNQFYKVCLPIRSLKSPFSRKNKALLVFCGTSPLENEKFARFRSVFFVFKKKWALRFRFPLTVYTYAQTRPPQRLLPVCVFVCFANSISFLGAYDVAHPRGSALHDVYITATFATPEMHPSECGPLRCR